MCKWRRERGSREQNEHGIQHSRRMVVCEQVENECEQNKIHVNQKYKKGVER